MMPIGHLESNFKEPRHIVLAFNNLFTGFLFYFFCGDIILINFSLPVTASPLNPYCLDFLFHQVLAEG
jgi:hypothetical protein